MLHKVIELFQNLDKEIKKIMKKISIFCFAFCLFSSFVLALYHFLLFPSLFLIGTILFKSSLMLFSSLIMIGFGFDEIKKQMA